MSEVKFDINPHVIRQLGAELVSDEVTALLELIKNSYDADASYVRIVIDTEGTCTIPGIDKSHKGYIVVEDNGFGMDRETLLKSWLIISYSNKREVNGVKPKTPKGRTPLGDKGLGRLSTQRLANCCEIFTRKEGKEAFHVGFNWSDFDKVERLGDVDVEFHTTEFPNKSGTKMVLLDLIGKNCWQGEGLERLKGSLCQIVAPYRALKPFNIYLKVNGEDVDIVQEMEKLEQLNLCDINFRYEAGRMNVQIGIKLRKLIGNEYDVYQKLILPDNGRRFENYLFNDKKKRGKTFEKANDDYWLKSFFSYDLHSVLPKEIQISEEANEDPGNFEGRIQEFYFGAQDKSGSWWNEIYKDFLEYKSFVQSQRGIKIYRNGFAIRPYGMDKNDWLNLSQGQTSGSSYYGLRPGNVVGYVAIDGGVNSGLRDKTDREGLIDNGYYHNFYRLVSGVVDRYAEIMENLRRCYIDFRKSLSDDNTKVHTMTQAFNVIEEQAKKGSETTVAYRDVHNKLKLLENKISKVVKQEQTGLFDEVNIELFKKTLNEVLQTLSESKDVLARANDVLENSAILNEALLIIEPKLSALENQLDEFTNLASLGLISEMLTHDLGQISQRMQKKGEELEMQIKSQKSFSTDELYGYVDFLKSSVISLKTQMKHLDPSLKYNKEKKEKVVMSNFLETEEFAFYADKLRKKGIDYRIVVNRDFGINMNRGRVIQIFDNLINNSIYWLERKQTVKEEGKCITVTIDMPWVYFEDNGDGVDKSVEDTLFEPFVTRKPRGEGRGLGLFIVRQLLDAHKCDIILDEELNSQKNRYRFSVNFNSVIDN